jgi:hypothetical protein
VGKLWWLAQGAQMHLRRGGGRGVGTNTDQQPKDRRGLGSGVEWLGTKDRGGGSPVGTRAVSDGGTRWEDAGAGREPPFSCFENV